MDTDKVEIMFKVGDKVQLKKSIKEHRSIEFATIRSLLSGIYEGGICLSNRIGGFRYWNIDDIELHPTN